MVRGLRAFCGHAGSSDWGTLLPYSDLFVSVVNLLTLWSQVFSVGSFSFLRHRLAVPRNPGWPPSSNLVWHPECWDCWCGQSCRAVRGPLGFCRCVSLCLFPALFFSPSIACWAKATFPCDSDCKGWLFLRASDFIHCGHNHRNVLRWVWDSCLQLWIAAEFTCTNTIQNVRGLLFTP